MGLGMQIQSRSFLRPDVGPKSFIATPRILAYNRTCQQGRRRSALLKAVASRISSNSSKKAEIIDEDDDEDDEDEDEFEDLDSPDDPAALTLQQVASLLNTVCEETDIAEVQLQMGSFGLKLRRKLAGETYTSSPDPAMTGTGVGPAIELPFQSTNSMDESQMLPASSSDSGNTSSTDEDDIDENLIYLGAPKVGLFRKHRYVKGKKVGKNFLVEEGAKVKKGQLLAFIEQLGTHVPITAPQAGEVVWHGIEDGAAVEYKEVVIELAPFFGGHIIGDRKYA